MVLPKNLTFPPWHGSICATVTRRDALSKRLAAGISLLLLVLTLATPSAMARTETPARTGRQESLFWIKVRWSGARQKDAIRLFDTCENKGLEPNAVSHTNDHGTTQINIGWKTRFQQVTGKPWSPFVYQPKFNTEFARWLFDIRGHKFANTRDDHSGWTCAARLGIP